jgi:hypothetical protein
MGYLDQRGQEGKKIEIEKKTNLAVKNSMKTNLFER